MNTPVDTPHLLCSSAKIASSIGLPPRPPKTFGHEMPAHPPSCSCPCHQRHRFVYSSPSMSPEKWPAEKSPGAPFGTALAASHSRASARNVASSGVSSKSTDDQTRTRLEHVLLIDEFLGRLVLGDLVASAAAEVLLVDEVQ